MCAEAVPWRCHRSLIADALTVRGIEVENIISIKRSQVHSLTSIARVSHSLIIYHLDEPTAWGPRTLAISIASRYNVMVASGISASEYSSSRNCAPASGDFSAVQTI